MARGWESKAVELQIESAKDGSAATRPVPGSDDEKKSRRERQNLLLARTYVLQRLESSSHERYTQSLRQALKDIDQKIAKLEGK